MKTFKLLTSAITTALILTACGGSDATHPTTIKDTSGKPATISTTTTLPTKAPEEPKTTLVTDTTVNPLELTINERRGAGVIAVNGGVITRQVENFHTSNPGAIMRSFSGSDHNQLVVEDGADVLGAVTHGRNFIDVSSNKTNAVQQVKITTLTGTTTIPVNYSVRRVEGVTGRVVEEDSATQEKVLTEAGQLSVVSTLLSGSATVGSTTNSLAAGYISGNAYTGSLAEVAARNPSGVATYTGRSDYLPKNATAATVATQGTAELKFDLGAKAVQSAHFKGTGYDVKFIENDFVKPAVGSTSNTLAAASIPSYITNTADRGARGYFYGAAGEMTAGTFYDQNGVGTFMASDAKLDKTATTIITK